MNIKKMITHLTMDIMDESYKARNIIKLCIQDGTMDSNDKNIEMIDVALKNIDYYARILIEGDGAE